MTDFYRSRFRFIFLFWLMLIAASSSAAELDLRTNTSFYSWQPLGDSGNSVNQLTQDIRLRLSESDLSLRLNLSDQIDLDEE